VQSRIGKVAAALTASLTAAAVAAADDFIANGLTALVTAEQLVDLGIGRPSVHVGQVATGDEFI